MANSSTCKFHISSNIEIECRKVFSSTIIGCLNRKWNTLLAVPYNVLDCCCNRFDAIQKVTENGHDDGAPVVILAFSKCFYDAMMQCESSVNAQMLRLLRKHWNRINRLCAGVWLKMHKRQKQQQQQQYTQSLTFVEIHRTNDNTKKNVLNVRFIYTNLTEYFAINATVSWQTTLVTLVSDLNPTEKATESIFF